MVCRMFNIKTLVTILFVIASETKWLTMMNGSLPSAEEIEKTVNDRYDDLFHECPNGDRVPFVCAICDEFILDRVNRCGVTPAAMKKMRDVLSWTCFPDLCRQKDLEQYFKFDITKSTGGKASDYDFLQHMCLSPRGVVFKKSHGNGKEMFAVCKRCHACVGKRKIPRHAILNANYVGGAPACLMELMEVELAFLSSVKGYGFSFTFVGGKQRNLKGTMTFMRVEKRRIAGALLQLESMGFNDHILCLLSGKMTDWQRTRAKELSTIRTSKMYVALDFLVTSNPRWADVNVQELRSKLENLTPVVYDRSTEVESLVGWLVG